MLGCAGIVNAARSGNVTIANAVGNGVADDKAVYGYVPDLIRYYLDEEPILTNVDTFDLRDPDQRAHVLDRLDELVVKPVDGSGGYGIVIGPSASDEQIEQMRRQVLENPRGGSPRRSCSSPPRRPTRARGSRLATWTSGRSR